MKLSDIDPLSQDGVAAAARALSRAEHATAIRLYARLIAGVPEREALLGFNLALARRRYRAARREEPLRVGICGWRMSDNSAGRAQVLADLYGENVEMFGALYKEWGGKIWPPLRNTPHPYHLLKLEKRARFPAQAFEFVLEHPYDLVHISKPRMPNIVFGLLYKLLWGARVIVDVDDEDLGGIGAETAAGLEALPRHPSGKVKFEMLGGKEATRVGIGLWDIFDAVTVSNPALQKRYGGIILPHARPAERFTPSPERTRASRERFGIPKDKTVVLFFGTARRHKGLIETAEALRQLRRPDVCFVIAGDTPDAELRTELEAVEGVDIRFLPVQPYEDIPEVVALGDICVLLQDPESLLAQYQLPAKLVDALAMGLMVFASNTPAISDLVQAGAVVPTTARQLVEDLVKYLNDPKLAAQLRHSSRLYFVNHMSHDSATKLLSTMGEGQNQHTYLAPLGKNARKVLEALGGWSIFQLNKSILRDYRVPTRPTNQGEISPSKITALESPLRRKVAVVSWDLAHNPAGRAFLLADIASQNSDVELIGPVFDYYGGRIWPPIADAAIPIRSFAASNLRDLVSGALKAARETECDIVHVSKPRLPSLLIGGLIRRLSGCPMVIDIDDHELSFVKNCTPADYDELVKHAELDPAQFNIPHSDIWTRFAEKLVQEADAISVSNVALQQRFGGTIVRHARDETVFNRTRFDRDAIRKEFGYSPTDRVVLFLGTPRPHKGIYTLADGLEKVADDRLALCIIGSVTDKRLLRRFQDYKQARISLHPDQPWDRLAELVTMADAVAILQDPASPITAFQLPAKLTDALALGIPVLATDVPPMEDLKESRGYEVINDDRSLETALKRIAEAPAGVFSSAARSLFMRELSYQSNLPRLTAVYDETAGYEPKPTPLFDQLFELLENVTGITMPDRIPLRGTIGAPAVVTHSPKDMVFLWKQNDSDLYGRRPDMIARYLLRSEKVRRIIHFDAPISYGDLERQAQHGDMSRAHQGNHIYTNTAKRILKLVDQRNFTRRTFLYRNDHDPSHAFGMKLPPSEAYPEFVRQTLDALGVDQNPLLWVCPVVPGYEQVVDEINPRVIIADIIDDQRNFSMKAATRVRLEEGYKAVIRDADAMFCNCEPVRKAFSGYGKDIAVIPNGIEYIDLDAAWEPADETVGLDKPIIGYAGNMRDRVNFELIEEIACRFPWASIVLIGSAHGNSEALLKLARFANVHVLGVKPYDHARRIIRAFDVALIPHIINPLSNSMNPLKLYVYFSLGVPIVSTEVANIQDLEDVIHVASSTEGFINAVENVLENKERFSVPKNTRRRLIRELSWEKRIADIWENVQAI